MNITEKIALRWLEGQGYTGITFRSRASPDFLTEQGIGFEIKKARQNTIFFGFKQLRALREMPEAIILIFDDTASPLAQFPFRDICDGRKSWKNFRICYATESHSHQIPQSVPEQKYYYTPREFATIYGLHENTVYNLIKSGKVKAIRIGDQWRIPTSELPDAK